MPSINLLNFPSTFIGSSLPLAAFGGSVVLLCLFALSKWTAPKRPPGPSGKWIIGNALDVPTTQEWKTWGRYKREYGPIISLRILGQDIIVLSDPRMVNQILEKRSAISSNRPEMVLATKIIGYGNTTVGIQHNAKHREARKLFNQTIGKANVTKYDTLVEDEMIKLVGRLLDCGSDKDEITSVIRHAVGRIIIAITYAINVQEKDDPYIRLAEEVMKPFILTTQPGAYFVDIFPILQYAPSWFPGATYKRDAPGWIHHLRKLRDEPVNTVKADLALGIYKTSIAHEIFADPNMTKEREEDLKWVAATMYLGGADTTASAIQIFVLAMARYPEVQRKAQLEIDTVIGSGRWATIKDRASLPYIEAMLKEVMRWHPITPMAGPHILTQDEVFEGYFLRKGTMIMPNTWVIMHDEEYFSDPMEFIPERFLSSEEKGSHTALLEPWNFVFGHGRRVCPGRDLAEMELWLAITSVLSTLDISPVGAVPPPAAFTSGSVSHPVPFPCNFTARSERAEAMIREATSSIN